MTMVLPSARHRPREPQPSAATAHFCAEPVSVIHIFAMRQIHVADTVMYKKAASHQADALGTDGDTSMNVYFPNSTSNRGTPIAVDDMQNSSNGDVALVHLSEPAPVAQYMPLADSYDATTGGSGGIEGYGLRANRVPTSGLYRADVSILGESTDAYGGHAIHLEGVNGASNHGDSGGPSSSTARSSASDRRATPPIPAPTSTPASNYANLTDSRQWIADVTGV